MTHTRALPRRLLALAWLLPLAAPAWAADEPAAPAAAAETTPVPATAAPSETATAPAAAPAETTAAPKPAETAAAPKAAEAAAPVPYSKKGADTCLTCHDDNPVVMAIFNTKHGQPHDARSPFGKGQLQCEACHGPGGKHTGKIKKGDTRPPMIRFGRDSAAPVAVQNGVCLACHEKSLSAEWHAGPHAANDVTCASCHDLHATKDPVLSARTQDEVCYTCHVTKRAEFLRPYAHPLKQGKVACSDCHQPHGTSAASQLVESSVNQTCYQCHAEKRGPFLWEHAPVAEDCAICHSPHGSSNPGMLKSRGPLLCQSCHSQQGHPSFAYGPSNLPGGSGPTVSTLALGNCMNCHSQVHGSNHPSGSTLTR
jgi:DmsE family decaheme c-type cytochrome